jgi:hypothetical protein
MALFPPIPLAEWADSKQTVHRFLQVVGKIRLAASVRQNHWWNVPFHVTGQGLTTRPMGGSGDEPIFTIDFDFIGHQLTVRILSGQAVCFPIAGLSVAQFYSATMDALGSLGVRAHPARSHPFDLPGADLPFDRDTGPAAYDTFWITRYWQVLSQVNLVLQEFAARYSGKTSPVHHFWHTMDIAVTRFSEREIEHPPGTDPVTREAYSREVISFGFWFGDANVPEPAFYSYTAPEPAELANQPLRPGAAQWLPSRGSHLAVLRYADAQTTDRPWAAVLDFYESAYQAGARLAGWDIARYDCPAGITDRASRLPA